MQAFRAPDPPLPESWKGYWTSFTRAMRATVPPRSERTLKAYGYALKDFAAFLGPHPPALEAVTRQHVEEFFAAFQATHDADYSAIHFRGLRRFFNWLVEEGDLVESPMRRLKAPRTVDEPLKVLSLEEIRQLVDVCKGRAFEDRRDTAIIRFLFDTGVRREGLVGMKLADVDLDDQVAVVRAKGGDHYQVFFGAKTTRDLDRYLRSRSGHPWARDEALWLGLFGPLTVWGLYQLLRRRAKQAKIPLAKAVHIFRHSFSHHFRMEGGDEGDLQVLGGWKSRAMLDRYGKSMKVARAKQAHQRFSPADRI